MLYFPCLGWVSESVSSLYYVFVPFFPFNLSLSLALSLFPLILLSPITGTYSQSAAIQLRGKDFNSKGLQLSRPGTPSPLNPDPPPVPLLPAVEQPRDRHPISAPLPTISKKTNEGEEGAEIPAAEAGISKIAGQESGVGGARVISYYRPTRRGSPRPSTHNDFDINEHLPWMIVLLLLLVLVVIVVCSVKRSSRVLKKGPMQDPSSIMEKAIQKKPPAPQARVKEKWIYYSNGQGKHIFSFTFSEKY